MRLRHQLAMHAAAHCGTDVAASIVKELAVHGRLRVWQVLLLIHCRTLLFFLLLT
jgi:hypothetical protein